MAMKCVNVYRMVSEIYSQCSQAVVIASTEVMMLQPCWNITNQSDGDPREL